MKILPSLPRLSLLVSLLVALELPGAERPATTASPAEIPLWPEGVPNAKPPARGETGNSGNYRNVSNPRLLVYAPPPGTANGTAFVYSPGGGYSQIAGAGPSSITQWMNSLGVTVFVLLYRLEVPDYPASLQDAVQAMRVVRSRSKEFGLDPKRIGAGGGSAETARRGHGVTVDSARRISAMSTPPLATIQSNSQCLKGRFNSEVCHQSTHDPFRAADLPGHSETISVRKEDCHSVPPRLRVTYVPPLAHSHRRPGRFIARLRSRGDPFLRAG